MTHEWLKHDRRIGISLSWDGLTWWYAGRFCGVIHADSGHVFGCWSFYRFLQAVRMYRRGK